MTFFSAHALSLNCLTSFDILCWKLKHMKLKVRFRVQIMCDIIWGNCTPKVPTVGVNRQFQARNAKIYNRSVSKTMTSIKLKIGNETEIIRCILCVVHHCPRTNPTWRMTAILKVAMMSRICHLILM